jgi:hypothetical protein
MVSDVPMLEIGQQVHQNEESPMEQDILSDQEFVRKMDKIIAYLEKKASGNLVEIEILNEVKKNLVFPGEISETQEEILLNEGEIKESVEIYSIICSLSKNNVPAIMTLNIENQSVSMEIDTVAVVSVCSEFYFRKYFMHMKLYPVDIPLKVVSGESLNLIGQILVKVKFDGKFEILPLVIMKGCNNVGILVGRNWLDVLVPKWRKAFAINSVENCFTKFLMLIKEKYQSDFSR